MATKKSKPMPPWLMKKNDKDADDKGKGKKPMTKKPAAKKKK